MLVQENVVGNAGLVHTNIVTAKGHDDDSQTEVSATDDAVVTLTDRTPAIVVTKTADPVSLPEPGGSVTYTVKVENASPASSDPLTLSSLVDDTFGNLVDDAGNAQISESTCVLGTIAPGATYECSFKAQVVGNAGLVHEDTVTAKGHDDDLPNPDDEVTGSATATVTLTDVAPSIVVTKVPDKATLPEPGGDVVFAVTVKNTSVSSDPVTLTSLVDSVFGNLVDDAGNAQISESTCVLGTIAPGAAYQCSFKAQVVGNAGLVHEDTVTAKGHDDDLPNPDDEVTGSATATVTLTDVDSTIEVTKTPSPSSLPEPGGDFTFQVTVENTSDTDTVTITSLVDRIGQQERNLDGEGTCDVTPAIVLAPGATYGCSFTTTFTSNGPASQSDVVTASGTDDDGNPVGDSAGATVRITDVPSSIAVTKTPSVGSIQAPGGDVTFTVVVTNGSAVDTVTVSSLSDSVYGDLDDQGTCSVPQQLAPGQSYQCQFTGSVTGEGGQQHKNTVTAGGTDDDGEPVSGEATATVEITTPPPPPVVKPAPVIDLVIVKEASSPTPLNGTVNYSLTVTNKGPDTATNVQLADPAPAGITYLTANPSQGTCSLSPALITCSLGNIAAGQTVTIAITGKATTVGQHTNTATVTGSGGRETNPADNVDSAVTVVPAPLKPPVKPEPKPEEFCLALTVSPKMIKADGKPDKVVVKVTAGKKAVKGVKVVVKGAGVQKTARTNGKGVAVLKINPTKAGLITVSVAETNQKLCGPKRIGVVGVFLPPLTG